MAAPNRRRWWRSWVVQWAASRSKRSTLPATRSGTIRSQRCSRVRRRCPASWPGILAHEPVREDLANLLLHGAAMSSGLKAVAHLEGVVKVADGERCQRPVVATARSAVNAGALAGQER